jgi:hypothetical protein
MSHPRRSDEETSHEDRALAQEPIASDTPPPVGRRHEPDADTAFFQEPGEPPITMAY